MALIYRSKGHKEVLSSPLAIRCFYNEKIEVIAITLKKGEEIPVHKNTVDVVFIVKSGTGIVTIEGERRELSVNDVAHISLVESRSLENPYDETLELMVIKLMA